VLQQVSGRTVLLHNRAETAAREAQAGTLLAAVDGVLSSSQLGSFSAPAWASPPPADGALRADITTDSAADAVLAAAQGMLARCTTLAWQSAFTVVVYQKDWSLPSSHAVNPKSTQSVWDPLAGHTGLLCLPTAGGCGEQRSTQAERLAAALAASEARRAQLERTVRDMPRLRRGIAYALTAWCAAE
jgi:hypothetical protein